MTTNTSKNENLNIKEVAKFLNCSVSTIRNLVNKREIPFFRLGVKLYFNLESIKKWIQKNEK